jgi:hypothetical protein
MADICVVHLVWPPLGVEPLRRFLDSYREHPAGLDHRLLMVFRRQNRIDVLQSLLAEVAHEPVKLVEPRFDLDAYLTAARSVSEPYVCLFNSSSELLTDGWLEKLARHLVRPGVGLVGATGSFEGQATTKLLRPFVRKQLAPFPNPHVRTNAFMLSRELMLDLDWGPLRRKIDAWRVESGPRNITRQVLDRDLEALVVGRDGEAYPPERWHASRTFRSGAQENLLAADNRTREFDQAGPSLRRALAEAAWGADVGRELPAPQDSSRARA